MVLQRKADLGICLVPYRPENTRGSRIAQLAQKLYASRAYLDKVLRLTQSEGNAFNA